VTDRDILRDLAKRYVDVCASPDQKVRRDLWRRHNSLKATRPLIYVRAFAWAEMPESRLLCEDAFFHPYENFLRYQLLWDTFRDDSIFEPWVTVPAVYRCEGWGVPVRRRYSGAGGEGSYKIDYAIKQLEDLDRLCPPRHDIDEPRTAERLARVKDAIGDIITVNLDRGPAWRMWTGDISGDLGLLRGIEHFMVDMIDHPEWLHRLARFMSDGILRAHREADAAGDWSHAAHQNQAMPYAEELPDPAANTPAPQERLWGYMASQEFTAVSPAMHEEFLLRYQLPILKRFGLTAYGCCEDLTRKIGMLRQIPNLRRIAVSPFADAAACAAEIGRDYVLSYRPSPTDMVGYGFDLGRIRGILRRDLAACHRHGCHTDITLKDVETVQGDPTRVGRWVEATRGVIGEVWG